MEGSCKKRKRSNISTASQISQPDNATEMQEVTEKSNPIWNVKKARACIDETQLLLMVFPEELWHLVLTNVNNSLAYHNIGGASFFFNQRLQKIRTLVLFPDVAKALFRKFMKADPEQGGFNDQELRPLRKVCHSWMSGVDRVLQSLDTHFKFPNDLEGMEMYLFCTYFENLPTSFDSLAKMETFKNFFKDTHSSTDKNPFVRYIRLAFAKEELLTVQSDEFVNILKNYGKHVWYCDISVEPFQLYIQLQLILEQMPNLKALRFHSNIRSKRKQLLQIQEYINHHPMPQLKHLRLLSESLMPFPVLKSLLEQSPQVSHITTIGYLRGQKNKMLCLESAPNLASLKVSLETKCQFQELVNAKINCGLVKLDVTFVPFYVSWKSVFHMLERNCGNTLKELKIWLPTPKVSDFAAKLHLPVLQTLKLEHLHAQPLDFLLPMEKTLKELHIRSIHMSQAEVDLAIKHEK